MEVKSLYWLPDQGQDLHILWGQASTANLTPWLKVKFTPVTDPNASDPDLTTFLSANPNARCIFKPTFQASLDNATGDYVGFNIRVNSQTGLVSVGANPDPLVLYNFTVIATLVADRNVPASPRIRAYIRIHLHRHVAKAWLTPSTMSVPKGISGFRFGLFAQFDDKMIGRLPLTSVIDWSSSPADKLNNDSGWITLSDTDPDGASINVQANLNNAFVDQNGGTVSATGVIVPYTLPKVATLIPGSAGYDRRGEVPNFLFLADGFQIADQPRFNALIDLFMRDLRQNEKLKPFDRLAASMNFWRVFVPSSARGVGTQFEVVDGPHADPVSILEWEFNLVNDSPTTENDLNLQTWGPNQVRLYFGLPILAHQSMSNDDVRKYWKQASFLPADLIDKVPDGMISDWKKQGDRRVVDESDTFIGTYYGEPTRAQAYQFDDRTTRKALFRINDERFTRLRLNHFLMNLQYSDENGVLQPLGDVWDTLGSNGKDGRKVIILVCSNSGRIVNNDEGELFVNAITDERQYISIEADPTANIDFADGRAIRMTTPAAERVAADLPLLPGKASLLHEMCHSLGLGDEYGENNIAPDDPRLVYTGTGDIGMDMRFGNLQVKSDLVDTPGSDDIDVGKLKWRWHRIAKSAVLVPAAPPAPAAITPNGAQYTIQLHTGQAAVFTEGDVVILRLRRPGQAILRDIEYSQVSAPRYPFVTRSPELAIRQVDAAADQVTVEPVNAGDLTGHDLAADFPAGCVLYKPQPARYAYPPTGENLEVIAANILEFMAGTRRPVHENVDLHGKPALDFDAEQSPDLSDPDLAAITGIAGCAKKNRDIIALYAGGMNYHHGVYHATGHCVMRDNHEIAELCSACKYILTDFIDPALHPEVDKQFDRYYPLKPL